MPEVSFQRKVYLNIIMKRVTISAFEKGFNNVDNKHSIVSIFFYPFLTYYSYQLPTFSTPLMNACLARLAGPSTTFPLSSGPQLAEYMSITCGFKLNALAST